MRAVFEATTASPELFILANVVVAVVVLMVTANAVEIYIYIFFVCWESRDIISLRLWG